MALGNSIISVVAPVFGSTRRIEKTGEDPPSSGSIFCHSRSDTFLRIVCSFAETPGLNPRAPSRRTDAKFFTLFLDALVGFDGRVAGFKGVTDLLEEGLHVRRLQVGVQI